MNMFITLRTRAYNGASYIGGLHVGWSSTSRLGRCGGHAVTLSPPPSWGCGRNPGWGSAGSHWYLSAWRGGGEYNVDSGTLLPQYVGLHVLKSGPHSWADVPASGVWPPLGRRLRGGA